MTKGEIKIEESPKSRGVVPHADAPATWKLGHRHHIDQREGDATYVCLVCDQRFAVRPSDSVECPGPDHANPNCAALCDKPHPLGFGPCHKPQGHEGPHFTSVG